MDTKPPVNNRTNSGWFARGRSGNPRGRPRGIPNKASREARAFCQALVMDDSYRRKFEAAWRSRSLPPALEILVWSYAYGKPTQALEVGPRQPTLEEIVTGVFGADLQEEPDGTEH